MTSISCFATLFNSSKLQYPASEQAVSHFFPKVSCACSIWSANWLVSSLTLTALQCTIKPCFSSTTLWTLYPAAAPWGPHNFTASLSVVLYDLSPSPWIVCRIACTLPLSILQSCNSSCKWTREPWSASCWSTASHSDKMVSILASIFCNAFWQRFSFQLFFREALPRKVVPSTKKVLPAIKPNFMQTWAHWRITCFNAFLFLRLNSAIVLWSGFIPPINQINVTLLWHSRSSFRLLRIP